MHVFEFTEKPEYIAIAEYGSGNIYASPYFAHWLINKEVLIEIPQNEACNGDLIFYFSEGQFMHAGLIAKNGRIISKWGEGYLYEHQLLEVPESYGNDIRFFKGVTYEIAIKNLKLFAEEME